MSSKKKTQFSATNVRVLLSVSLIIATLASAGGFIFMNGLIRTEVGDLNAKKQVADASDQTIAQLQTLERKLTETQLVGEKIDELRESSSFPEFKIVDSIATLVNDNKLNTNGNTIKYTYSHGEGAAEGQTPPANGTTPQPQAAKSDIVAVTMTFDREVSYENLVRFLADVERTSSPKMRVNSIRMSPTRTSTNMVEVEPITIEMYIKK